MTSETSGVAFGLDNALAWLAQAPDPDPLRDLVPLRRSLRALARADVPPSHRLRIVKIFEPRLRAARDAIAPLLLGSSLPLPQALRDITNATVRLHGAVADILLDAALSLATGTAGRAHQSMADICKATLIQLRFQLDLALLAFGQAPEELWSRTAATLRLLRESGAEDCPPLLGQMLALAAAQPESFAARELHYLRTVLELIDEETELSGQAPPGGAPFFWLDPETNMPPVASSRQAPPRNTELLYLRFSRLLNSLDAVLEQLESGTPAVQLGLPRESNLPDYLNVLRRARGLWAEPPRRQFRRRRDHHKVSICVRLSELWGLLQDQENEGGEEGRDISEWTVINKSPEGYAVEHLRGNISGLVPGGALGMRESPEAPWSICLIRWVRGTAQEHIEMGLEFMAPHAAPVRVVSATAAEQVLPGLLLPALPRIERGEALLVARGSNWRQEFNLIAEKQGQVRLTTCQPATLLQQTSSVEIFEFKRLRTAG